LGTATRTENRNKILIYQEHCNIKSIVTSKTNIKNKQKIQQKQQQQQQQQQQQNKM
jgi:hypothetical protein